MKMLLGAGLRQPSVERMRKNHGLEHATIHVLSECLRRVSMAGRSDRHGFTLYGNVSTEVLTNACERALKRLRSGERGLAIHPYCGTNFVTTGVLASVVAALALLGAGRGWRASLARLPLLICLMTAALIFSQPLGQVIQRDVTTSGDPGELEIVSIKRRRLGRFTLHRVETCG